MRGMLKPISTLRRPLESVDLATREPALAAYERRDVCVVPAAGVIGEAMVAMVLAQALLEKFGGDSLGETRRNYRRISGTGEEFLMVYPIVKYGDPVLEREADDVTEFDTPELHKLIEDMFESMYAAKGVGLAAPQIGVGEEDRGDRFLDRRARSGKDRADQSRRSSSRKARRQAKKAA